MQRVSANKGLLSVDLVLWDGGAPEQFENETKGTTPATIPGTPAPRFVTHHKPVWILRSLTSLVGWATSMEPGYGTVSSYPRAIPLLVWVMLGLLGSYFSSPHKRIQNLASSRQIRVEVSLDCHHIFNMTTGWYMYR